MFKNLFALAFVAGCSLAAATVPVAADPLYFPDEGAVTFNDFRPGVGVTPVGVSARVQPRARGYRPWRAVPPPPRYRKNCRIVKHRVWNGRRWVRRIERVCR
ncbi:MAG: hypothetical protein LBR29_06300 [Methylobacteriaceae bacterium]|jgi:hypothetical protein|nr:hypothetical protein [Methylobacteriaceae bacterium]